MTWTLEIWAYDAGDSTKAVKLVIKLPEGPTADQRFHYRGRVLGVYRWTYQEWADSFGERIIDPRGQLVPAAALAPLAPGVQIGLQLPKRG